MENGYANFINRLNNSTVNISDIYEELISVLDYKSSTNFNSLNPNDLYDYDAEYKITIEENSYTIIGIKILDNIDEERIAKIHLAYWNKNDIPFSILILPNEVRIYNNFSIGKDKIIFDSKEKEAKLDLFDAFSDQSVISGVIWNRLKSFMNKKERVDSRLLENLRKTIVSLHDDYAMNLKNAYSFLAQCIFIKYLEDRKMLNEKAFLPYGAHDFVSLLENKNVDNIKNFYTYLKDRFNGDLFDMNLEGNFPNIDQITLVHNFFKGDQIYLHGTSQITFFCYDFSIIPIELISNIYETFLKLGDTILKTNYASSNGAYYTPYFLADFMVQKSFKLVEKTKDNKLITVLDPACGSGVFLVGSFNKLIEKFTKSGGKITGENIRNILENRIYGVDNNPEALKIACFSLYIALLEYLEPKDITENNFRFPNLIGKNLFECSFFDPNLNFINLQADLIIGNPPWVSDKTGDHIIYCKNNDIPISDKQLAQAFIGRSKDFADDHAIVSLIVTNSMFTNYNARAFRNYLFNNFEILDILNLNQLKNTLFLNANAPCSILTLAIYPENTKNYIFDYFAFRPNLFSDILNRVVYDKSEIIRVKKSIIQQQDYIWHVLTYGDEFDVRVIKKINACQKLSDLIKKYKLHCGRGYAVGSKDLKYRPNFTEYRGGNLKGCFKKYAINYNELPFIKQTYYERPRPLSLYTTTNKLLIKRTYNHNTWGAAYSDKSIIFTDDFHCIQDKSGDNQLIIKYIEAVVNSKLFLYYCFHISKIASAIKPELTKEDLLAFPIPNVDDNIEIIKGICEKVKTLEKIAERSFPQDLLSTPFSQLEDEFMNTQNEIDNDILDLYELDDIDRETINYSLKFIIPSVLRKSTITEYASENDYLEYSNYLCSYFNKLLFSQGLKIEASIPYSQQIYTIIMFSVNTLTSNKSDYGDILAKDIIQRLPDLLGLSSLEAINNEMLIKNKISGFLEEGFFVIKTKEFKNWTTMSAIKDANFFTSCVFNSMQEAEK